MMILAGGILPLAPADDQLHVLTTTLPVVIDAPQVTLDGAAIDRVAAAWASEPWPPDVWDASVHWFDGTERTLNWLALVDALNFCFWGEPGQPRWGVRHQGRFVNGYEALALALSRAVTEGLPLFDAGWLARLNAETLGDILRPDPDDAGGTAPIPLFDARLANARQLGLVLQERFEGQFARLVESALGDAALLAKHVASDIPSFRDVAHWQQRTGRVFTVYFYKRAQILVGDVATAFGNQGWGAFTNLGDLTAFADYKVPQLLRRLGLLEYAPDLAARIDRLDEIPAGSEDEVAIRAATIWGVELLRRALAARDVEVTAAAIDHRLWQAGQSAHALDRPYHHTRTTYY